AEPRSTSEIGRPVARIHVADGDQIAGSGKGEDLPPLGGSADGDAAVDLGEAWGDAGPSPTGLLVGSPGFAGRENGLDRGHSVTVESGAALAWAVGAALFRLP